MKKVLAELQGATEASDAAAIALRLRQSFNELMDVDKHYQRKEHVLFSCLERHGITGPSKVMWAKDDDARALLKLLGRALSVLPDLSNLKNDVVPPAERAMAAVSEMIYKEENILLP